MSFEAKKLYDQRAYTRACVRDDNKRVACLQTCVGAFDLYSQRKFSCHRERARIGRLAQRMIRLTSSSNATLRIRLVFYHDWCVETAALINDLSTE